MWMRGLGDTVCATMLKAIQINKCVLISDNKFELYFWWNSVCLSASPAGCVSLSSPADRGQVPGPTGIPPALATATATLLNASPLALLEQVDRSMTDEIMLTCHKRRTVSRRMRLRSRAGPENDPALGVGMGYGSGLRAPGSGVFPTLESCCFR